jgi:CubicO group peptidase (beta-lactamase class C family)
MIKKKNFRLVSSILLGVAAFVVLALPVLPASAVAINKTNTEAIEQYVQKQADRSHLTGVSYGIVQDGKVTLKGYGELTPDSPVIIASLSKSFTALAIMQQVDKGAIRLDDPVVKFIPDFKIVDGAQSQKITVGQLLSQTSGLSTKSGQIALNFDNTTLTQAIDDISKFPLAQEPGKTFTYSNANFIVAGRVLEAASGMNFDQYMSQHIFAPLEMHKTSAKAGTPQMAGFVKGNINVLGAKVPMNDAISPALIPDGYIISTASDMTKYLTMQLNGGVFKDKRVVSEKSLHMMHSATASLGETEAVPNSTDYGLGWGVGKVSGQTIISHDGQLRDMQTNMALLPQTNTAIIVFVNEYGMLLNEGATYQGILKGVTTGTFPGLDNTYLTYYIILDLVILISLGLMVRSFIRIPKWRAKIESKGDKTRRALRLSMIADICYSVIIALLIFVVLGASFGNVPMPLSLLMFGTADLTIFLLVVIAFFICRPIVRFIYWRKQLA